MYIPKQKNLGWDHQRSSAKLDQDAEDRFQRESILAEEEDEDDTVWTEAELEKLHEATRAYSDRAMDLLIQQDPHFIDREVLKEVIDTQRNRCIGCLTLPFSLLFFLLFAGSAYLHEDITNVYLIETGLRTKLGANLDQVESIHDVWVWINNSLVPNLFRQSDQLTNKTFPEKDKWSLVLDYNKLEGPMVMRQRRSLQQQCAYIGGASSEMTCYPMSTTSDAAYGHNMDNATVQQPSPNDYAGGKVTLQERLRFFSDPFTPHNDKHAHRLLRPMRPEYMTELQCPSGNCKSSAYFYQASLFPNTNYSLLQDQINFLYKHRWLDSQSKELEIQALLLNAEVGRPRLEVVKILFSFSRGGGVFAVLTLESIFLMVWTQYSALVDFCWLTMLTIMTVLRFRSKWHVMKEKGFHVSMPTVQGFTLAIGWLCILGWVITFALTQGLVKTFDTVVDYIRNDMPADTNQKGSGIIEEADKAIKFLAPFRIFLGVYHLLLTAGFFTAFKAQPKLGVVAGTLESSVIDIIHFLIVLLPTFVGYAISGCLIFGRRLGEFATVQSSIFACFKMLLEGEYEWPNLSEEHFYTSMIWVWSFMLLLVMLMLNMVLAIVMDIYTDTRKQSGTSETVWQTLLHIAQHVWYRKRWIHHTQLSEAARGMERLLSKEDIQRHFPEMCPIQLNLIFNQCLPRVSGGTNFKDSVRLQMAIRFRMDRVMAELDRLCKGDVDEELDSTKLYTANENEDRGWLPSLASKMAVQNHLILSVQWQLQQLQWQWSSLEAMTANDKTSNPELDRNSLLLNKDYMLVPSSVEVGH